MVLTETGYPAKQHARSHLVPFVDVEQRIGKEAAVGRAITLAEVGGQLDRVNAHSARPSARPRRTATNPAARLTSTFINASRASPSWAGRCVSSIQVEKVV